MVQNFEIQNKLPIRCPLETYVAPIIPSGSNFIKFNLTKLFTALIFFYTAYASLCTYILFMYVYTHTHKCIYTYLCVFRQSAVELDVVETDAGQEFLHGVVLVQSVFHRIGVRKRLHWGRKQIYNDSYEKKKKLNKRFVRSVLFSVVYSRLMLRVPENASLMTFSNSGWCGAHAMVHLRKQYDSVEIDNRYSFARASDENVGDFYLSAATLCARRGRDKIILNFCAFKGIDVHRRRE